MIFTFIFLSFSVGTAQSYLQDEANSANGGVSEYRERFDKMIENALDVVRIFCVLFCGPTILLECLLSIIYYNQILNGCPYIEDTFTNILIYVLIIMGCVSLTVTGFCCYMSFLFAKTVKDSWSDLRHPPSNINVNR